MLAGMTDFQKSEEASKDQDGIVTANEQIQHLETSSSIAVACLLNTMVLDRVAQVLR